MSTAALRYVAFSDDPRGGNPAGVVLDATDLSPEQMLAVAADVGFSETAFLGPVRDGRVDVRYFSPLDEVAFCGHATIAAAVALADRTGGGTTVFATRAGDVPVETSGGPGRWRATLTSTPPSTSPLSEADLTELLAALRWSGDDLDPALLPAVAYAGVHHPVIAVRTRARLADLDYDLPRLGALMAARSWTTVDLVWRESPEVFHARNPFPPGGVVEDPATGAAAAALGGYLRAGGHVRPPAVVTVLQGADLGRPSTLTVEIPPGNGGIRVTGAAVPM